MASLQSAPSEAAWATGGAGTCMRILWLPHAQISDGNVYSDVNYLKYLHHKPTHSVDNVAIMHTVNCDPDNDEVL